MALRNVIDLSEYRRVRQQVPAAASAPVYWVPVWVMLPAWRLF